MKSKLAGYIFISAGLLGAVYPLYSAIIYVMGDLEAFSQSWKSTLLLFSAMSVGYGLRILKNIKLTSNEKDLS